MSWSPPDPEGWKRPQAHRLDPRLNDEQPDPMVYGPEYWGWRDGEIKPWRHPWRTD